MNAGDIYQTPGDEDRLILGRTAAGDIGFARRGGKVLNPWDHCAVKAAGDFAAEARFLRAVYPQQLEQVQTQFGAWMASNGVV